MAANGLAIRLNRDRRSGPFQISYPALFRGVRASVMLAGIGRHFGAGPAAGDCARQVNVIDIFLSHSWRYKRLPKVHRVRAFHLHDRAALRAKLAGAPALATAHIFFDKLCIVQDDAELKRRGIDMLGGFLAGSETLLVIADSTYWRRLWCIWEIAAFTVVNGGTAGTPPAAGEPQGPARARGTENIDISIPERDAMIALMTLARVFLICLWYVYFYLGLNQNALYKALRYSPILVDMIGVFGYLSAVRRLIAELNAFNLGRAECSREENRCALA